MRRISFVSYHRSVETTLLLVAYTNVVSGFHFKFAVLAFAFTDHQLSTSSSVHACKYGSKHTSTGKHIVVVVVVVVLVRVYTLLTCEAIQNNFKQALTTGTKCLC